MIKVSDGQTSRGTQERGRRELLGWLRQSLLVKSDISLSLKNRQYLKCGGK